MGSRAKPHIAGSPVAKNNLGTGGVGVWRGGGGEGEVRMGGWSGVGAAAAVESGGVSQHCSG